jgi:hypothetical protein
VRLVGDRGGIFSWVIVVLVSGLGAANVMASTLIDSVNFLVSDALSTREGFEVISVVIFVSPFSPVDLSDQLARISTWADFCPSGSLPLELACPFLFFLFRISLSSTPLSPVALFSDFFRWFVDFLVSASLVESEVVRAGDVVPCPI